jgi:uncharacterized protein (DUF4213/DUF364 family)
MKYNSWSNTTNIIDSLLSTLDYETPVRDIRQGPFQTAVLTRYCGLSSTPHEYPGTHHEYYPVTQAGSLLDKDARTLANMVKSENTFEAAIGLAAINSLLDVDEQRCTETNAADLIADRGQGKRIAIIGHFPFVPRLRPLARELWVIEKNPQEDDLPETEADRLLPRADVIAITGMAFTNHTIEPLLALCHPRAYVVILGGSTPLSPLLFDYGISALSGTRVIEPETVLRCVSQGATFRQLKGVRRLTMQK